MMKNPPGGGSRPGCVLGIRPNCLWRAEPAFQVRQNGTLTGVLSAIFGLQTVAPRRMGGWLGNGRVSLPGFPVVSKLAAGKTGPLPQCHRSARSALDDRRLPHSPVPPGAGSLGFQEDFASPVGSNPPISEYLLASGGGQSGWVRGRCPAGWAARPTARKVATGPSVLPRRPECDRVPRG